MAVVNNLATAAKVSAAWRTAQSAAEVRPLRIALEANWHTATLCDTLRSNLPPLQAAWAYASTVNLLNAYAAVDAQDHLTPDGFIAHDQLVLAEHVLGRIALEMGNPIEDRVYGVPQWQMVTPQGQAMQEALIREEEALAGRLPPPDRGFTEAAERLIDRE